MAHGQQGGRAPTLQSHSLAIPASASAQPELGGDAPRAVFEPLVHFLQRLLQLGVVGRAVRLLERFLGDDFLQDVLDRDEAAETAVLLDENDAGSAMDEERAISMSAR